MRTAAEMLSVSRRTVENYINLKLLPARKLGRRTVLLVRDLEKFLRTDQPSVGHKREQKPALNPAVETSRNEARKPVD